jgi:ribosomal protein S18 acetylase RimI-like enzyme
MSADGRVEVGVVRVAEEADASAVGHLLHRFQTEFDDYSPGADVLTARVPEAVRRPDLVFLLAGDPPAGLAELRWRHSILTDTPEAYLEELYVVPERRGEGLGRALLREVVRLAREANASAVHLVTSETDTAARRLYEAEGFTNLDSGGAPMLFYEREF